MVGHVINSISLHPAAASKFSNLLKLFSSNLLMEDSIKLKMGELDYWGAPSAALGFPAVQLSYRFLQRHRVKRKSSDKAVLLIP